eukprot:5496238-Alexandrium_andersonii.AAC.1
MAVALAALWRSRQRRRRKSCPSVRARAPREAGVRGVHQGPGGHRLRRRGLGDARAAAGRARRGAWRDVPEGYALLGGGRRPHPRPRR